MNFKLLFSQFILFSLICLNVQADQTPKLGQHRIKVKGNNNQDTCSKYEKISIHNNSMITELKDALFERAIIKKMDSYLKDIENKINHHHSNTTKITIGSAIQTYNYLRPIYDRTEKTFRNQILSQSLNEEEKATLISKGIIDEKVTIRQLEIMDKLLKRMDTILSFLWELDPSIQNQYIEKMNERLRKNQAKA